MTTPPQSAGDDLRARDARVIWHPYTPLVGAPPPLAIVRGEGASLIDDAGRRYLDAGASWWVNLHGHSHPVIAARVSAQLATLEHVIFAGCTHEGAVLLAERLLAILPANQARVFYSDNGSTAVEVALKMALQHWQLRGETRRRRIVTFAGDYHGDTFGAMSVSERGAFTAPFASHLFEAEFIPAPRPGREAESLRALEALAARGDVAAFIFEPLVQGVAGFVTHEAAALDALLGECRDAGILTIADEVLTGFGRTGRLFACDHLREQPDMVCLGKGLTGGTMTLGATTVSARVAEPFASADRRSTFFHGHSYTANPVACAAGLASLDLLLAPECRARIDAIARTQAAFATRMAGDPRVAEARNLGTLLALELGEQADRSYFHPRGADLARFFLDHGILLRPLGNVIYTVPPYCTTPDELSRIHACMEESLALWPRETHGGPR